MNAIALFTRTSERIDRFATTIPAFRAMALVKGEMGVISEALDNASGADDGEHFSVWMDAAQCSLLRLERHLAALRAEIARGAA